MRLKRDLIHPSVNRKLPKMKREPIEIIPFSKEHFSSLKNEVPDSRFLVQWAGNKYIFPLSWEQMSAFMDKKQNGKQVNYLFSAHARNINVIIGHVQLTVADSEEKIGRVGSVLVFKRYRGRGFGNDLMKLIMNKGFIEMKMKELKLNVFGFNTPALRCYEKCGFRIDRRDEFRHEGEYWELVKMAMTREDFYERKCCW